MNPWQQPPGPNWGPPPPGPGPQPYGQQPYPYYPPGHPPGYAPGYGQPPPGYYPQRPASSGTASTSMVLGLLLTLFQGLAAIGYFAVSSELSAAGNAARDWMPGYLAFEGVARLAVAAALITGTILLIRRRHAGRWVIAGAAIAVIVLQGADYGVRSGVLPTSGASPLSTLVSVILPIALIVVALSGSTRRWLDEARLRRGYPPYPT